MNGETLSAEQALLGLVLYDQRVPQGFDLKAEHFAEPVHGRVWSACLELSVGGKPIDPTLICHRLKSEPAFNDLGGNGYIFDLIEKAPPAGRPDIYIETILDEWGRRMVANACRRVQEDVWRRQTSSVDVSANLRADLHHIEQGASIAETGTITASDAAIDLVDCLVAEAGQGTPRGLLTGLKCIDRRLRGLRPSWLVVIGGRPSMGKTALARNIAYGAATINPGHLFAYFTAEMSGRELTERALSSVTHKAGDGIRYVDMSGPSLGSEALGQLRKVSGALPSNLVIDDRSSITVEDIARKLWALKRRMPVGAVVVDYLQLLVRPHGAGRNDAAVIGEMTSALKRLAGDMETCIILLSQLSRRVEERDGNRPQLSDLRESGSIEQDANAVLFAYRAAYYTERDEPDPKKSHHVYQAWEEKLEFERRSLDVIAAKVRSGAIGTDRQECWLEFDYIVDQEGEP